jgi:acyl-[acyl-carrier-protein]-phospholipid O-acyltransferase/long-chain-fatty-acid--[acyl-carrier-protein] ligase
VADSGLVATPIEVRTKDFWRVVICLFIVGASAGMYVTPLQALLQKLSPVDARGQYIAASNAIDTVWEGTAIGLFYLLRNVGVGSQEIFFLVVGVAGLTVTLFVLKIQPHIHKPEWN